MLTLIERIIELAREPDPQQRELIASDIIRRHVVGTPATPLLVDPPAKPPEERRPRPGEPGYELPGGPDIVPAPTTFAIAEAAKAADAVAAVGAAKPPQPDLPGVSTDPTDLPISSARPAAAAKTMSPEAFGNFARSWLGNRPTATLDDFSTAVNRAGISVESAEVDIAFDRAWQGARHQTAALAAVVAAETPAVADAAPAPDPFASALTTTGPADAATSPTLVTAAPAPIVDVQTAAALDADPFGDGTP